VCVCVCVCVCVYAAPDGLWHVDTLRWWFDRVCIRLCYILIIHPSVAARPRDARKVYHWLTTELFGRLGAESLPLIESPVSPAQLADIVDLIEEGISRSLRIN